MSSQRLTGPGFHAAPGEGALRRPGDGRSVLDLLGPIRTTKSYSGLALALGSDATESSTGCIPSKHTSASVETFHTAPCDSALEWDAMWHNATTSSAGHILREHSHPRRVTAPVARMQFGTMSPEVPLGLYPANNNYRLNHNEGWARNTAAEPPTATAMVSPGIIQMEMLSPPAIRMFAARPITARPITPDTSPSILPRGHHPRWPVPVAAQNRATMPPLLHYNGPDRFL
ncbi:hypothetical protein JB92DRAFT_3141088 [Gautieria morchelliformis]|nr:hypothetical protein JB92DRAFT_3141088 [Gautieria morchelliformis]